MLGFLKRNRERARQALADADALIARFGDGAYAEARRRALGIRTGKAIDGNRPEGHWDRVRIVIGRKTGRQGLDTASRYIA
jgi:hypothetical protein